MDNLFKVRTLTRSINAMRKPGRKIFQRFFAPVLNFNLGDRLAWDIITGSEGVLKTIKVYDPAIIGNKTGRKTILMEAPRLSEKRLIHTAEINNMRAYGALGYETMRSRIAREQMDMRNKFDRTLEFWASRAMRGKVYDSDLSTILVDYGFAESHLPSPTGPDLWTAFDTCDPVEQLRSWKRTIEDDSGHEISGWYALCGFEAMNCLLNNEKLQALLTFERGRQMAEEGAIVKLSGVTIEEYNSSFVDDTGTRQRFVDDWQFTLIGLGADVFDCPYIAVADEEAPAGIGSGAGGSPELFFSKSWIEKDPSGRWIKGEARTIPVVRRPAAIINATVGSAG